MDNTEKVINEAQNISSDIEAKASQMGAKAQQMGSAAIDVAQQKAGELKETAVRKGEEWKQAGREQAESLERTIRKDPVKSVLIASGIGFFLGYLLRR